MLFKKLKCSGPPPHRNRTDDWWLLGNKRSAMHIGREKTRDAKRFHFLLIIPLVSGWFGKMETTLWLTVWGGEVKLTTELGTELTVKKVNHASRCYAQSRLTRFIWARSRITLRSHHASRKPPLPPWYFICGVLPIDMIEDWIETF